MHKSNITGGKHHKKGKKNRIPMNVNDNKIEYAGTNQVYAIVKKKTGGTRLILECSDGKERSGIIPGKFFKKIWMNAGDILLCDLNVESDDSQCYIVHKYSPKDSNILKSQGKITFDIMDDKQENSSYKFAENIPKNVNNPNKINIQNIGNDNSSGSISNDNNDSFLIKNPNKTNTLNTNKKYNKNNENSEDSEESEESEEIDLKKL